MKIYSKEPTRIIRLQIVRKGEDIEYLNLVETTQKEIVDLVKNLLTEKRVSPFMEGSKTSIHIREALGAKNLKSVSVSFRGLSAKETLNLIKTAIQNENNR